MTMLLTAYMLFTPFIQAAPALPTHDYGQDVIITARGTYWYGEDFTYAEGREVVVPVNVKMLVDIPHAHIVTLIDGHYEGCGVFVKPNLIPAGLLPNPALGRGELVFLIDGERIVYRRVE